MQDSPVSPTVDVSVCAAQYGRFLCNKRFDRSLLVHDLARLLTDAYPLWLPGLDEQVLIVCNEDGTHRKALRADMRLSHGLLPTQNVAVLYVYSRLDNQDVRETVETHPLTKEMPTLSTNEAISQPQLEQLIEWAVHLHSMITKRGDECERAFQARACKVKAYEIIFDVNKDHTDVLAHRAEKVIAEAQRVLQEVASTSSGVSVDEVIHKLASCDTDPTITGGFANLLEWVKEPFVRQYFASCATKCDVVRRERDYLSQDMRMLKQKMGEKPSLPDEGVLKRAWEETLTCAQYVNHEIDKLIEYRGKPAPDVLSVTFASQKVLRHCNDRSLKYMDEVQSEKDRLARAITVHMAELRTSADQTSTSRKRMRTLQKRGLLEELREAEKHIRWCIQLPKLYADAVAEMRKRAAFGALVSRVNKALDASFGRTCTAQEVLRRKSFIADSPDIVALFPHLSETLEQSWKAQLPLPDIDLSHVAPGMDHSSQEDAVCSALAQMLGSGSSAPASPSAAPSSAAAAAMASQEVQDADMARRLAQRKATEAEKRERAAKGKLRAMQLKRESEMQEHAKVVMQLRQQLEAKSAALETSSVPKVDTTAYEARIAHLEAELSAQAERAAQKLRRKEEAWSARIKELEDAMESSIRVRPHVHGAASPGYRSQSPPVHGSAPELHYSVSDDRLESMWSSLSLNPRSSPPASKADHSSPPTAAAAAAAADVSSAPASPAMDHEDLLQDTLDQAAARVAANGAILAQVDAERQSLLEWLNHFQDVAHKARAWPAWANVGTDDWKDPNRCRKLVEHCIGASISMSSVSEGSLILFVPYGSTEDYVAVVSDGNLYFLCKETQMQCYEEACKQRLPIVSSVVMAEEKTASERWNPYGLENGATYYVVVGESISPMRACVDLTLLPQ